MLELSSISLNPFFICSEAFGLKLQFLTGAQEVFVASPVPEVSTVLLEKHS